MQNFMNKATANPMHNTLQSAIEALGPYARSALTNNWSEFYAKFQETCDAYIGTRPGQGLYTTGVYSVIHACNHMRHMVQDMDALQMFSQLAEAAAEQLQEYEKIDTKVNMYWYSFSEDYASYMPHCNNRILEDFQRLTAKYAHQEYIHNPNEDLRVTATKAVQQAAVEMQTSHADKPHIVHDMQRVHSVAAEHRSMILDTIVAPYEPKMLVHSEDYEGELDENDLEETI